MGHERIPNNFRRLNKKKLVLAALIVGLVLLVALIIVGAVVFAIINGLLGQTDSGTGKAISGLISTLWSAAIGFVQALWKQVIANPLQFLTGGGN